MGARGEFGSEKNNRTVCNKDSTGEILTKIKQSYMYHYSLPKSINIFRLKLISFDIKYESFTSINPVKKQRHRWRKTVLTNCCSVDEILGLTKWAERLFGLWRISRIKQGWSDTNCVIVINHGFVVFTTYQLKQGCLKTLIRFPVWNNLPHWFPHCKKN